LEDEEATPERRNYNYVDLAKLAQAPFQIYVFCKAKGHGIIKCP
jgi:hypothetical protein